VRLLVTGWSEYTAGPSRSFACPGSVGSHMSTISQKTASPQIEPIRLREPNCRRCGATLQRAQSLLDLRTGRTVRLYVCACGEPFWPDDPEN
jgi:hypothetical protein